MNMTKGQESPPFPAQGSASCPSVNDDPRYRESEPVETEGDSAEDGECSRGIASSAVSDDSVKDIRGVCTIISNDDTCHEASALTASPLTYQLGDPAGVAVSWDIREEAMSTDWIGLYLQGDTDPGNWIDFRNRGVNGTKKGRIIWKFDHIERHFTMPETQVCFKYYYGKSGCLRATTQTVTIKNTSLRTTEPVDVMHEALSGDDMGSTAAVAPSSLVHFVLKDISAAHLRKGMFFNPDPYIKLWLQPAANMEVGMSYRGHQHHTSICENTTEPHWIQQEFAFRARPTDLLVMKLKDKFVSSRPTLNRFLGMVTVPVKQLLEQGEIGLPMKLAIMGRSPRDHASGNLSFTVEILKGAMTGVNDFTADVRPGSPNPTAPAPINENIDRREAVPLRHVNAGETHSAAHHYDTDSSGSEELSGRGIRAAVPADSSTGSTAWTSRPAGRPSSMSSGEDTSFSELSRDTSLNDGQPNVSSTAHESPANIDSPDSNMPKLTPSATCSSLPSGKQSGVVKSRALSTHARLRRHAALAGSLSLASGYPGAITPLLMRSSSLQATGDCSTMIASLPAGWEARTDVYGRTFYIDHLNRKTTWVHPGTSANATPVKRVPSLSHEQICQMDQRYSVVRRLTIKDRGSSEASPAAGNGGQPCQASGFTPGSAPGTDVSPVSRTPLELPACSIGPTCPSVVVLAEQSGFPAANLENVTPLVMAPSDHHLLSPPTLDSRPVSLVLDDDVDSAEHQIARGTAASDSSEVEPSCNQQSTTSTDNPPALRLLLRSDFFSLVQYNDDCQKEFLRNVGLKHMVHKIRKSPETFYRYMHNRDLVAFLNKFVQHSRELPQGWEMKLDKHRKPFFVDHSTKSTSYIDPRLPTEPPVIAVPAPVPLPLGRHRISVCGDQYLPGSSLTAHSREATIAGAVNTNASALSSAADGSIREGEGQSSPRDAGAEQVPLAYDAQVVAFLRQDGIMAHLQERSPSLHRNESLKKHLAAIIADGVAALQRYRNSVDLTLLLSLFEQDIVAFNPRDLAARTAPSDSNSQPTSSAFEKHHQAASPKSDFQEKYRLFHQKLRNKGYGVGPGKIKMRVRRDHLLQDTYNKIMSCSKRELQKSKLLISFEGEEGLDYGGPAREFFFLFSREIFNPYYGLFEYSANDMYTVQISPVSQFVDMASEWFRFAGRMIGLCMLHQYLMDCYFTRPFYKMFLKEPCDLTDLESLDAEFHQSLLWVRDTDITDSGLDLTFSVDEEMFGQVTEHELKPGGRDLAVTQKNKHEYIDRMVKWRIERGVADQKQSLLRGFHEVIDQKLVAIFDAKELELVIAGTAEIDIADWQANTEYRSGYYAGHPIIVNYWKCIERFSNEQRLRLLQFVTGTSSIPFEGFVALRGSNGPRKFTIERWGDTDSLPRAHTCFNRLDLPPYLSLETMMEKLRIAVEETGTFGAE